MYNVNNLNEKNISYKELYENLEIVHRANARYILKLEDEIIELKHYIKLLEELEKIS